MTSHFHIMPVDRSTIQTRLRIHPSFLSHPDTFIRKYDLPVRSLWPRTGERGGKATKTYTLSILRYRGIRLKLETTSGKTLARATIDFNPGVCLFGHNGWIPSLTEFLHALALLRTKLTPFLEHPSDAVDIVPGLREGGPAYWSYVEIPFQCVDPEGKLLSHLRHLRHPSIKAKSRHWPDSIKVGGTRSKIGFSIYRKAVEMIGRKKLSPERLSEYERILRLEVRLRDEKLVQYLGEDRNVEEIDGKLRLVRFHPQDLICGHREAFGALLGVYQSARKEADGDERGLAGLGRLLARVAKDDRTHWTFPDLVSLVATYTGGKTATISKIRKAGISELERLSEISKDALLSDTAYQLQPSIASAREEDLIHYEIDETHADKQIHHAYSPIDQPFKPHVSFDSYHQYPSNSKSTNRR